MSSAVQQIQPGLTLEKAVHRIHEVFSLPDVAMRVLEVVTDSNSSVADLRAVVECDPALVSRLLRTINSSAYGLRSRIDSVHKAIALLGFNEIKNLAATAAVADMIKEECIVGSYSRIGLWRHLVSVALSARLIASRSGITSFDEAYMCGLLHDIGITLIDQHQHELFETVITSLSTDATTPEVEQRLLGFDHTQLGSAVAKKWGFPASVVDAIRYHHNSERCSEENRPVIRAVEIANFLCSRKEISSVGIHNVRPPDGVTFAALSIGRDDLKVLWDDIDVELEKATELVKI